MTRAQSTRVLRATGIALVAALASCSPSPPRRSIVILLDAARADRFSSYGYERETTPNMDRIAARGHVFANHHANGVNTRGSMPCFLFSRYFIKPVFPYSKSVALYSPSDLFRVVDEEAVSFPRAMSGDGIRTAAISAHQWFHPETDFAREFEEFTDLPGTAEYDKKYIYPSGDVLVDHALSWLGRVEPEEEFLLYLHFMDTHFPHLFEEDAQEFFEAEEYDAEGFNARGEPVGPEALEGRDRDYVDALYDGSLRWVDRELGRLFDALEAKGWLDDTLIAITSDHGEMLWHHANRFLHGGVWLDTLSHVPMIVSGPGIAPGGRTDDQTQGADVHPTLLARNGVDLPAGKTAVGLDMFDAGAVEEREWIYMSRGMRSDRYKFVFTVEDAHMESLFYDPGPNLPVRARVYDLHADPEELVDLMDTQPALGAELFRHYLDAMRPNFRRYFEAVADVPPRGSFAIGVRDLRTASEVPVVTPADDVTAALAADQLGWVRSEEWGNNWLRGRAGGGWLEVRARVPSGEYTVDFLMNGALEVETPDGEVRRVEAPVREQAWDAQFLGRDGPKVSVVDQDFRLRLRPASSVASLRHVGFAPVGADASLDGEERTEALRALGYAE